MNIVLMRLLGEREEVEEALLRTSRASFTVKLTSQNQLTAALRAEHLSAGVTTEGADT